MAKKSRKRSVSSTQVAAAAPAVSIPRTSSNRSMTTEFNPDYSYVRSDLKRIGILASSFFVVLVILSFFLR